jgi:hypothetical protein
MTPAFDAYDSARSDNSLDWLNRGNHLSGNCSIDELEVSCPYRDRFGSREESKTHPCMKESKSRVLNVMSTASAGVI